MKTASQHRGLYSELRADLNGNGMQKRGDTCIPTADSLFWTAETIHSIVKQLYSNKNLKKKKRKRIPESLEFLQINGTLRSACNHRCLSLLLFIPAKSWEERRIKARCAPTISLLGICPEVTKS